MAAVQANGEALWNRRIRSLPEEFAEIVGDLPALPAGVAFEATYGWGWFADRLADLGLAAHMSHLDEGRLARCSRAGPAAYSTQLDQPHPGEASPADGTRPNRRWTKISVIHPMGSPHRGVPVAVVSCEAADDNRHRKPQSRAGPGSSASRCEAGWITNRCAVDRE